MLAYEHYFYLLIDDATETERLRLRCGGEEAYQILTVTTSAMIVREGRRCILNRIVFKADVLDAQTEYFCSFYYIYP
jgi:hypothetical protein